MWELVHRDRAVVEPIPERLPHQVHTDLGDARIISVENGAALLGKPRQRHFDPPGDRLQLAVAIELVAEKVEDDRRARLDLVDRSLEARLIDFEDAPIRSQTAVRTCPLQRRSSGAQDEVGARAIRHHALACAFEEPAQTPRRRRLAGGAGDDDGTVLEVSREVAEYVRIDGPGDVAGQRRAAPEPADSR